MELLHIINMTKLHLTYYTSYYANYKNIQKISYVQAYLGSSQRHLNILTIITSSGIKTISQRRLFNSCLISRTIRQMKMNIQRGILLKFFQEFSLILDLKLQLNGQFLLTMNQLNNRLNGKLQSLCVMKFLQIFVTGIFSENFSIIIIKSQQKNQC